MHRGIPLPGDEETYKLWARSSRCYAAAGVFTIDFLEARGLFANGTETLDVGFQLDSEDDRTMYLSLLQKKTSSYDPPAAIAEMDDGSTGGGASSVTGDVSTPTKKSGFKKISSGIKKMASTRKTGTPTRQKSTPREKGDTVNKLMLTADASSTEQTSLILPASPHPSLKSKGNGVLWEHNDVSYYFNTSQPSISDARTIL